jgi:hypothetical protein
VILKVLALLLVVLFFVWLRRILRWKVLQRVQQDWSVFAVNVDDMRRLDSQRKEKDRKVIACFNNLVHRPDLAPHVRSGVKHVALVL